ncbi:MAG TPA: hypothetical protein VF552_05995 [Allosphingosinicella sp.]|jgi:hypothetical protein
MSGDGDRAAVDPYAAEWLRAVAVMLAATLDSAGFFKAAAYAEMAADAVGEEERGGAG